MCEVDHHEPGDHRDDQRLMQTDAHELLLQRLQSDAIKYDQEVDLALEDPKREQLHRERFEYHNPKPGREPEESEHRHTVRARRAVDHLMREATIR